MAGAAGKHGSYIWGLANDRRRPLVRDACSRAVKSLQVPTRGYQCARPIAGNEALESGLRMECGLESYSHSHPLAMGAMATKGGSAAPWGD